MRMLLVGSALALSGCVTAQWATGLSVGSTGCYQEEMTVTRQPTFSSGSGYVWELECNGAHFVCNAVRDVHCSERRVAPKPAP